MSVSEQGYHQPLPLISSPSSCEHHAVHASIAHTNNNGSSSLTASSDGSGSHTTTEHIDRAGMSMAIQVAKKELRRKMKTVLSSLDQSTLDAQSRIVTEKILAHPLYRKASRLSVYISMPTSELRTDAIILDALRQNKKVFIPYVPPHQDSKMEMLALKDEDDFKSLKPNKWQIREFEHNIGVQLLSERENALDEGTKQGLDLILLPGMAFDKHLNRCGHGRGYYDTYLHRCAIFSQEHGLPRPSTIALALDEQILDGNNAIPTITFEDGHASGHRDIKPDSVVSPSNTFTLDA